MLELVIFVIGTVGLVILSRHSLVNPRSHGFPRFFAFEAILGLLLLNARAWLIKPLSLPQLVSWVLLTVSIYPVVHGFWVLQKYGKPDKSIPDTTRLALERTTRLVTAGPYRFIRHPMYVSLLYFAWGIFLKQITLLSGSLVITITLALYATAVLEERENLRNFGEAYAEYMLHTKRFLPYLF